MRHPNAYYLGDKALVDVNGRMTPVTITAFTYRAAGRQLVEVEYPDGMRGHRAFTSLGKARRDRCPESKRPRHR